MDIDMMSETMTTWLVKSAFISQVMRLLFSPFVTHEWSDRLKLVVSLTEFFHLIEKSLALPGLPITSFNEMSLF